MPNLDSLVGEDGDGGFFGGGGGDDEDGGDDDPASANDGGSDGDAGSDAGSKSSGTKGGKKKKGVTFAAPGDAAPLSDDEEALERADAFEAAYNFRFEEPGGGEIVTHARSVESSLRRKDTGRKEARERRKERKAEERRAAEAETRRLMNLKRAEAKARLVQVRDVAGAGVDMDR